MDYLNYLNSFGKERLKNFKLEHGFTCLSNEEIIGLCGRLNCLYLLFL